MDADQVAKDLAGLKLEDSDSTKETRVDANDQTGHDSVDQVGHDSVDQKGNGSVDQTGRDSTDHGSVPDRETGGVAGREAAAPGFSQVAGPVAGSETGPNDQSQSRNIPPSTSDQSTQGARGFVKCGYPTCKTCKIALPGETFTDYTGTVHTFDESFTCTTQSVIYAICCTKCGLWYVGMSNEKPFSKTMERHIRKSDRPVYLHFNQGTCGHNDRRCFVIERVPKSKYLNEKSEYWKKTLNTIKAGLNER